MWAALVLGLCSSSPLRGHSTIWRDERDVVVKKVVYADAVTRLTARLPMERRFLNSLADGWEYEAFALPQVNKLLYRRTRRLTPANATETLPRPKRACPEDGGAAPS